MNIINSKEDAIKSSSWNNPGATLYDKIKDSAVALHETYLVVGDKAGEVPYSRSGCKYPHHVLNKDGDLVLSIAGVKAAYNRAKQMGIFNGDVKKHLMRHYKELDIYKGSTMEVDEKITENFNRIEEFLGIDESRYIVESYDNSSMEELESWIDDVAHNGFTSYTEASHGKLKYDFRFAYDINTGHLLKIVYSLDNIQVDYAGHAYNPEDRDRIKSNNKSANKEVQQNIFKKGNIDHSSHGQKVVAIVDTVTGDRLKSAKTISAIASGRQSRSPEKEIDDSEIRRIVASGIGNITTINVGSIDNASSFKSTALFNNLNKAMAAQSSMKSGRGAKLKDFADNYRKNGFLTPVYNNPSNKEGKEFLMDFIMYAVELNKDEPHAVNNIIRLIRSWNSGKFDGSREYNASKKMKFDNFMLQSAVKKLKDIGKNKESEILNNAMNELRIANIEESKVDGALVDYSNLIPEGYAGRFMHFGEADQEFFEDKMDLYRINSPETLLSWMDCIKYDSDIRGWRLNSAARTMTIKEGNCHDQSLLEAKLLDIMNIENGQLFFIEVNDGEEVGGNTHTLTWYIDNNNYYWFEHSWENYRGIHGPYNNINDLKDAVYKAWENDNDINSRKFERIEFFDTPNYKVGMTLGEYVNSWTQDDIMNESVDNESDIIRDINDPSVAEYIQNDPYTKKYLDYISRNTGLVAIDPETHQLAGYIFVGKEKDPGFISTLEVKPEYRGKGFGSMLLDAAINELGAVDLVVDKDNKIAFDMYKNRGFNIVKEVNGNQYYMKLGSVIEESTKTDDDQIEKKWFIRSSDGVDNCCVKVKGYDKPMRGRSSMITLNPEESGEWFVLSKKHSDGDYGVPGGGWDKNEDPKDAAIRELKEEAQRKVRDVKQMGTLIEYHDTVKKWVKDHVDEKDWWYGYYSEIFVGIDNGISHAKIDERDKEEGYDWIGLSKAKEVLPKEYVKAIEDYIAERPVNESTEPEEEWLPIYGVSTAASLGDLRNTGEKKTKDEMDSVGTRKLLARISNGDHYNHILLSFNDDLTEMYSFNNHGIVRESIMDPTRWQSTESIYISVMFFKKSDWVKMHDTCVDWVKNNRSATQYAYSDLIKLFFSKPVKHEKRFLCSSFAGYILSMSDRKMLNKDYQRMRPEDLTILPRSFYVMSVKDRDDFIARKSEFKSKVKKIYDEHIEEVEEYNNDLPKILLKDEMGKLSSFDKLIAWLFSKFAHAPDTVRESVEELDETSHGSLKNDFRFGYDYNTGHSLKIVYELSPLPFTKTGNLDHRSTGQKVLAIVDEVNNASLPSATVISPRLPIIDKTKIDQGTNFKNDVDKFLYRVGGADGYIHTITVGEIDNAPVYKSTKWFGDAAAEKNHWDMMKKFSDARTGRGVKLESVNDDLLNGMYQLIDFMESPSVRNSGISEWSIPSVINAFYEMASDYESEIYENHPTIDDHNQFIYGNHKVDLTDMELYDESLDDNRSEFNAYNEAVIAMDMIIDAFNIPSEYIRPIEESVYVFTEADENDPPKLTDTETQENISDQSKDQPEETTEEPPSLDDNDDVMNKLVEEEESNDEPPVLEDNPEEETKEEVPQKPVSMPKQTDAAEKDKNGVRRKKLYIAFIEWCKKYNKRNTFGSIFDKDIFHNVYPFVPDEMRYFYRLANPILCVLGGELTFFQVSELRKLNKDNKQMNKLLIFAATPNDMRVFNTEDKKVYLATEEGGAIKLGQVLGETFDTYIQGMIKQGDILNGPIEQATPETNEEI